ncbi:uncharacterized protein LOC120416556 [Culex pipiens pallens]|uniref:uncharacterized protein LOC120416556 n=1 Tax=Culex pipiens pallens TaxID=42434 RepID=UPI0019544132|nr:uncharacterized protein LOC120416556 [Culex pipiens pallens]
MKQGFDLQKTLRSVSNYISCAPDVFLCSAVAFVQEISTRCGRLSEMSDVRKNTLVVDFSVLPERPQLEVVQRFVEKGLGIASSDLKSIQLHNIRHCVLIEMADATAASRIATENHLKYAFKTYPSTKIPVYVDDNTIDVRIHDLPLDLPNSKIAEAMREYGEVLTIRDEVWKNFFTGVPNGVRALKMKLTKPVPSYVTVCNLPSLATYTGQIATCRRCGMKRHVSKSCSEAAKKTKQNQPKPANQPAKTTPAAPIVLPPANPPVVESQVITPHNGDNGNDGFTTVLKKGKSKRQLLEEDKKKATAKKNVHRRRRQNDTRYWERTTRWKWSRRRTTDRTAKANSEETT